uniref:Pentatricopeptide repeat-containing protein n=1 Tax=Kalanchoe fedtschenkoi TaxID=63787 RepID=A0A7N0SXC7_KALFE
MKPSTFQLRRFSSAATPAMTDPVPSKPSAPQNLFGRNSNPLAIPHRTLIEPKGQDLDFINVAHSHLIHADWEKLKSLSSGLTQFRVQHILLKTQKDYVLSLEFFNWVSTQNPNFHSLNTHSMILHILTKNRKFKSSEAILRRLLGPGNVDLQPKLFDSLLYSYRMCQSSHHVFDSFFKTCAHLKKFRNATDTFCRMKEYGFFPNVESCNAYLSSMIKMKRLGMALWFYGEMRKCRISPNVYTLNMVMCAFCQLGELDKAIGVFEGMGKMGFKPSVVSYGTLISGYLSKGLVNSAMKLKSEMVREGISPTVEVFNALINGFCKDGKVPMANKMFGEMKAIEVIPNVVTYNTLIDGYGRDGKIEMGLRLFEEMGKRGLKADILTYNALILGLCKDGKTKKAAYLVKELDKAGLAPNASTFSALIYGQCVSEKPDRGLQLLRSMIRSGFGPNYETFVMLITSFCKCEDLDGAVQVLKVMKESMALSSATLAQICSELCGKGDDQLALKLYKEIHTRDLLPEGFDIAKVITEVPQ